MSLYFLPWNSPNLNIYLLPFAWTYSWHFTLLLLRYKLLSYRSYLLYTSLLCTAPLYYSTGHHCHALSCPVVWLVLWPLGSFWPSVLWPYGSVWPSVCHISDRGITQYHTGSYALVRPFSSSSSVQWVWQLLPYCNTWHCTMVQGTDVFSITFGRNVLC